MEQSMVSHVPEMLGDLQSLFGPNDTQAQAAAKRLGQAFRELKPSLLEIFMESCEGPAVKRRRAGEFATSLDTSKHFPVERKRSVQQLSALFPRCIDPDAFEALAPHLHLSPQEWVQVWPAFQLPPASEASALLVLLTLAAKDRGLVDAVVLLVTSRRVRRESFREAVASAVPPELGSAGHWVDDAEAFGADWCPQEREIWWMRDVLAQSFAGLFPLCQDEGSEHGLQKHTWTFDIWWSELTGSLQGAAPGAALALVATTLLQLQKKGPLTLELILRPKRRRQVWTWLTQQAQMLPEAQSVTSFMTRLGRHSMQVEAPTRVEAVDLEKMVPDVKESLEDVKESLESEVQTVDEDQREAAWYQTAT